MKDRIEMIEFIRHQWYWVVAALVSGGMLLWPLLRGNKMSLTPAAATLLMNREDALVLDVRETSEWNNGHIANARHLALTQFDKRLVEIEKFKQTPVIVCCAMGSRGQTAAAKLEKAGFEKVFNLAGGIAAWSEAGLPLTRKS
ncbi:Rhodanese-related sulfurtransferase [Georgfuchsia toluolica]|uniref:Rhodanese-related sulfurtransferase n=1 Tax=Georgfuchsia toluolica TaxID=424218 RepID=A0A916J731_9PROT|nr:rhodanese-like domain-containing protein [Georgfuchsia toluolica]CAG4885215.1 Rhodanese-related sulfurtransferase [Georgfuchsia toluolica]